MKKILSLMTLLMLSITATWADAADPILIKWNETVSSGNLEATYSCGDFKLTRTDTSDKHSIDANTARFGTAASWDKFDHRFKVGGKSGSGNKLTLAIPEAGVLRVFPRSASGSATDRNLILTQNETELYNQVVKDEDAVDATEDEATVKVYPVVEVPVVAGNVEITYPVGALNFYGFELVNYTVAGSSTELLGSSWDTANTDNDMTLTAGTYKWEKTNVMLSAGDIEFKVVRNHSFDNPAYPASNYQFSIPKDGLYNVTITFDQYTKDVTATAIAVIGKVEIRGSFNGWDTPADGLVMVKQGETNNYVATLDLTDVNENVLFKFVLNDEEEWLGWNELTLDAPAEWTEGESGDKSNIILKNGYTGYKTYTMTATWTPSAVATANWTLKIEGKDERPAVYYAAGDPKVWGVDWTVDESNKLTENGAGKYEITKSGLTLSATSYDYKVVKVVGLAQTWIPDPGAANQLVISETAAYDVTLTFDPTEPLSAASYEAVATKTGDFYTVAGAYYDGEVAHASIFGTTWDAENTANNMVKGEGNVYTKTYAEVDMPAVTLQFKVVKNRDWDHGSYPAKNYELVFSEAGKYDITISFNADTKEVTATATKVPKTITSIVLKGSSNGWTDPLATFTENIYTNKWTATDVDFAANDEFYVLVNYNYGAPTYLCPESTGNFLVNEKQLNKDLTLVANSSNNMYVGHAMTLNFSLKSELTVLNITCNDSYWIGGSKELTGTESDYEFSIANIMAINGETGFYEWSAKDIFISETVKPVFRVIKNSAEAYYPAGDAWEINLDVTDAKVATKYDITITFNAATDYITVTATKSAEPLTIGTAGWATTVTSTPLDFSTLAGDFEAYTATYDTTKKKVSLSKVNDVPAETGLVLKSATPLAEAKTFYVPIIASSETDKGDLQFSSTYSYTVNDGGNTFYCYGLAVKDASTVRFAKIKDGQVIPAKKAFLMIDKTVVDANELTVSFDNESGDVTGINTLNAERNTLNGEMYNVAGQKVSKNYKGLVISNGKKVMMK